MLLGKCCSAGSCRRLSRSLQQLKTIDNFRRPQPRIRAFPIPGKSPAVKELKDAFDLVKTGDNIFIHGIAATPTPLLDGLCEHVKSTNVNKVTLHHLHLEGDTPWTTQTDLKDKIRSNSLFTGHNLRTAVNEGVADFNSCFLHEVPLLFSRGAIKLNGAFIHVSPPDVNGYCSLGSSCEATPAAIQCADYIIGVANKNMPRTFGDGLIHQSQIDVLVYKDFPLHLRNFGDLGAAEEKIGELIAEKLVDNGATLQMGIGAVPDAALAALKNHKDLGIHTEMFSDGILPLLECNAITNAKKFHYPGRNVVSFVYGSKKLYEFLHDNPLVYFGDVQWVNDPAVVRQNPKVTAINSAIEVDLTGQVVADSIGHRFVSGFGGQVDFIRGAAIGNDGLGKPIIALPSMAKKGGQSKIVPFIQQGSGVVTTRAHVHYVVTEHGIAQLWGKNMRQRAYQMIQIAHPDKRQELERAAFKRMKVMPSAD